MSEQIVQPSVPFVGKDGRITREWYLFLLSLFNTTGGVSPTIPQNVFQEYTFMEVAPSVSDIRNGLAEALTMLMGLRGMSSALQQAQTRITELEGIVRAGSRAQEVSRLTQRVADLESRLAAQKGPMHDQRTTDTMNYIFARR